MRAAGSAALNLLPPAATTSRYHQPLPESTENLRLLRQFDQLYLKRPFYGSRKIAVELEVNRKRIQRLMRILGIEDYDPKPKLEPRGAGSLSNTLATGFCLAALDAAFRFGPARHPELRSGLRSSPRPTSSPR